MSTETSLETTSKREKFFYSLGDVGSNFVWSFAAAFLTLYYTDSAGISAAFVGTMMLIARLFDGISDIGMGIVIDKTRTRWGKARPWLLFMCVPLALSSFLLYNVPEAFGTQAKNVYIFLTYFFMSVICYTAINLSYHSMLPRISLTAHDRNVISVVRLIVTLVVVLLISVLTTPLLERFGGMQSQHAWTVVSGIYAVLALAAILMAFFGVKEKVPLDIISADGDIQKVPLKDALRVLLSSRYFYIVILLFFTYSIANGISGIGIYYVRDVLGNANLYSVVMLMGIAPMIVGMPFLPALFKRFGKRNAMAGGLAIAIIASIAVLFNPSNIPLFMAMMVVRGFGFVPLSGAVFTLASDIVEYNDWKKGVRAEGLTTSASSFGTKIGTGLGAAVLGWSLAWGQYDGSLAIQPQSAINAMIGVQIVLPLVVYILAFILLLFWNLEKYQSQIAEFKARREQSEDALAES